MKKQFVWSFIGTSVVMIAALILVLAACSKQDESPTQPDYPLALKSDPVMMTFDLIANQNQLAGTVTFTETASGLLVTYNITGGWQLGAVHAWIGTTNQPDYSKPYGPGYPASGGGPVPGQFPYKFENLGWVTSFSFTIPKAALGSFCDVAYYVLCHSSLRILNGGVYQNATGWSEGDPTPGSNWGMISFFEADHVLMIANPAAVCEPETIDLTVSEITAGSTDGFTFTYWLDEACTQELANPEAVAESGTYYIKGTSPMGCVEIAPVVVTIYPAPEFIVTNPDLQEGGSLFDLSSPSVITDIVNVETFTFWADPELSIQLTNPITLPQEDGTYTYWIMGTSVDGCVLILPVEITVGEPGPPDIGCVWEPVYGGEETAWAAGYPYNTGSGNWATYTPYVAGSTVTLNAGQNMVAGTVSFSSVNAGVVTIIITLSQSGDVEWRFQNLSGNVKIQDYPTAPSGNPQPGQFDWKYTVPVTNYTFSIGVPANNFYGVHVDVEKWHCIVLE